MCLGNSSPHHSESAILSGALHFVDVSDSLSKVEGSVFFVIDTLDLEQSETFVLSCDTSFETCESGFGVESKWNNEKKISSYLTGCCFLCTFLPLVFLSASLGIFI